MGGASKKPRKNKLDPKVYSIQHEVSKKKERDWTFDDILRSKTRRR